MNVTDSPSRPYFAHAINVYNTPLEAAVIRLIERTFPGTLVENPNQPHHQVGYAKYAERAKQSSTAHKGMNYFYDEVLPLCDGCVAMPFLDKRMGLGVAGEAKWFADRTMPIWLVLSEKGAATSAADLRKFIEDPLCGLFTIVPLTEEETTRLVRWDQKDESTRPGFVVPHVETRLRTYFVYNREPKRPFEEAHLAPTVPPPGFYPDKS